MPTLKERWKTAIKNKYIIYGFVGAPLVLLLVSLLMRCASAAELFDKPPYVFLGLDYSAHGGLVCYENAVNGAEANLGVGIPILSGHAWEINGQWSHLSCAFDDDRQTYDGIGLNIRWYPTLWWSK